MLLPQCMQNIPHLESDTRLYFYSHPIIGSPISRFPGFLNKRLHLPHWLYPMYPYVPCRSQQQMIVIRADTLVDHCSCIVSVPCMSGCCTDVFDLTCYETPSKISDRHDVRLLQPSLNSTQATPSSRTEKSGCGRLCLQVQNVPTFDHQLAKANTHNC